jgi:hypothetical protein
MLLSLTGKQRVRLISASAFARVTAHGGKCVLRTCFFAGGKENKESTSQISKPTESGVEILHTYV